MSDVITDDLRDRIGPDADRVLAAMNVAFTNAQRWATLESIGCSSDSGSSRIAMQGAGLSDADLLPVHLTSAAVVDRGAKRVFVAEGKIDGVVYDWACDL